MEWFPWRCFIQSPNCRKLVMRYINSNKNYWLLNFEILTLPSDIIIILSAYSNLICTLNNWYGWACAPETKIMQKRFIKPATIYATGQVSSGLTISIFTDCKRFCPCIELFKIKLSQQWLFSPIQEGMCLYVVEKRWKRLKFCYHRNSTYLQLGFCGCRSQKRRLSH